MEKLKKIINQINSEDYLEFESLLVENNSAKFLYLFKAYKNPGETDEEIKSSLNCNDNALYVLKSRLYDKVQKFILNKESTRQNGSLSNEYENLTQFLYEYPRETAIAMISEIESNHVNRDDPNTLIHVYSALKKAHYYSDKYYTYSQLYNKQVAYTIALEKAEDTLFNFNRTLANYFFSSSESDKDLINLLKAEIKNIFALNNSPRIALIQHIISIQIMLFTDIAMTEEEPIEDLLEKCEKILIQYKDDKKISSFRLTITFLQFEYYKKINQFKKSLVYFDTLDQSSKIWLLQSNNCMAFNYLFSKIDVLLRLEKKNQIGENMGDMYIDPNDLYTIVIHKFYTGISHYFQGKLKSSITILNDLLNEVSFKSYFHIETEIKLSLAYLYIKQKEFDIAENLLKSLTRKLSSFKGENLKNIKEAIKMITLIMTGIENASGKSKFKKTLELFTFYNSQERKILSYLQPELEQLASGN